MIARAGSFVCLLLFAGAPLADDLGRLFFSAAERRAFDAARTAAAEPPPPEVSVAEAQLLPEGATPVLPPLTVNGLVARTRGPTTAWVNGASIEPGREFANDPERLVRMRQGALELTGDPRLPALRLKPGQTYDPVAARIFEAYDQMPPRPD